MTKPTTGPILTASCEVLFTREDADAFFDALAAHYPGAVTVSANGWHTPEPDARLRITSFGMDLGAWKKTLSVDDGNEQPVQLLFPWPGWKLESRPYPSTREMDPRFPWYWPKVAPPLWLILRRCALLGEDELRSADFGRGILQSGVIQMAYHRAGPLAEPTRRFVRTVKRVVRKMSANQYVALAFENFRVVSRTLEKDPSLWAGQDAQAWARADPDRVFLGDRFRRSVTYERRKRPDDPPFAPGEIVGIELHIACRPPD